MSFVKIHDSTLTAIANAIRTKRGTTATMLPSQMPTEIGNISSGGTDVSDTTAVASSVRSPYYFYTAQGVKTQGTIADVEMSIATSATGTSKGSITPSTSPKYAKIAQGYSASAQYITVSAVPTETKSATPSSSSQTITPTTGKFLSSVTVAAVPTESKSATPSESAQTITPTSGKFLSRVNVEAIPSDYKKQKVYTSQTGSGSRSYPAAIGETRTLPYKTYTESEIGFTPRGVMIISQDSSASQCSGYWSADIPTVYGGSYWQSVIQTQYFKVGTTYYIPLFVSSTVIFYA